MYIHRDIEETIHHYMASREILAVVGPRQCGKSTMLGHLLSKYEGVNVLSFDNVKLMQLFEEDTDSFISLHVKNYKILFIDEIQYLRDSGRILKYIYDNEKIKIIISGSSSPELSISSLKYLVGRIFIFEMFPLSFSEFLSFRDKELYKLYRGKRFGEQINRKLLELMGEFITFGGYPRVVTAVGMDEKRLILENIYSTFLLKEVRDILQLSNSDKLIRLMKALALQISNLIQYNELSQLSGFDQITLRKYMTILEETYICRRCRSFYSNKRLELVKTPKIFFIDHGLRNTCIGQFEAGLTERGHLYENLVFSEQLKKGNELQYWRTTSKAEVDFVIDGRIAVEIKVRPKITRSLLSFISKYGPEEAFIVSEEEGEDVIRNGCRIRFVPFTKFV